MPSDEHVQDEFTANHESRIPKQEESEPEPHSIYTPVEKWFIVALIAFGVCSGEFWRFIPVQHCSDFKHSPPSSHIYCPVIPTLSQVFRKPIELINLTVTMYIVFQGLGRFGTLADYFRRGLMFICCLLLLSASCIGLALVPSNAYWLLLLLRCLQSAGSASTIALGAGVIGDISTLRNGAVGPVIGPVLGGVLTDRLGWRPFLCISSTGCALILILFLPETLRSLVGNGSILPPAISSPVLPLIGRRAAKLTSTSPLPAPANHSKTLSAFSIGGGMLIGSASSRQLLDWDYQRVKRSILAKTEKTTESHDEGSNSSSFPIEKARLRLLPILLTCFVASCAAYGWCIERRVSIAGPLVFLVVGLFTMAIMNAAQTLILDLVPSQSLPNNLVRCALSAAFVAVIQPILSALGAEWTYVLLAGMCVVVSPLIYIVIRIGPRYCVKRRRSKAAGAQEEN
ncbi:MFS general substrate transporter [Mycena albidolilacea]|uniref:MFS general substrate transporter n=1 Tax=Mycena albidolilacea TaxID=1033008 RepID=A0AAD7ABT8_9AGAR|nr:MFS general substrate transporter [Mycena albidolilacea]